jgi:hypothetical protein
LANLTAVMMERKMAVMMDSETVYLTVVLMELEKAG